MVDKKKTVTDKPAAKKKPITKKPAAKKPAAKKPAAKKPTAKPSTAKTQTQHQVVNVVVGHTAAKKKAPARKPKSSGGAAASYSGPAVVYLPSAAPAVPTPYKQVDLGDIANTVRMAMQTPVRAVSSSTNTETVAPEEVSNISNVETKLPSNPIYAESKTPVVKPLYDYDELVSATKSTNKMLSEAKSQKSNKKDIKLANEFILYSKNPLDRNMSVDSANAYIRQVRQDQGLSIPEFRKQYILSQSEINKARQAKADKVSTADDEAPKPVKTKKPKLRVVDRPTPPQDAPTFQFSET